ncbi:MAG: amidase, partial [Propionibacterium sp.]|nr:amidase [Propionibacterium sp.]
IVVRKLKDAGGLFAGKTNTPEMGYYGGTDNHLFGPTHNPWKHGYTAGGSSGGSAAAVAAGMVPLAEGSDGAGSVRIPAAMCGVVGLKPTTGVIPAPFAFIDWAYNGPLTRTVQDNALMLDAMSGHELGATPSARRIEETFVDDNVQDLRGLRVAWSPDLGLGQHVDPEVLQMAYGMVEALRELGADVAEASPAWENPSKAMWHGIWVPAYGGMLSGIDMESDPGSYDERLRKIKAEAQAENLAQWGVSLLARGGMFAAWHEFMNDYDVLVSPTLASAPFPLSQFAPEWLEGKSVREEVLDWLLTYPFNMLNNPAITIPAGFTKDGGPVGFQISARHWEDARVLGVASALEAARPWAEERPTFQ